MLVILQVLTSMFINYIQLHFHKPHLGASLLSYKLLDHFEFEPVNFLQCMDHHAISRLSDNCKVFLKRSMPLIGAEIACSPFHTNKAILSARLCRLDCNAQCLGTCLASTTSTNQGGLTYANFSYMLWIVTGLLYSSLPHINFWHSLPAGYSSCTSMIHSNQFNYKQHFTKRMEWTGALSNVAISEE